MNCKLILLGLTALSVTKSVSAAVVVSPTVATTITDPTTIVLPEDMLWTNLASTTAVGLGSGTIGANYAILTDGSLAGQNTRTEISNPGPVDNLADARITYSFDLTSNILGYNISQIDLYSFFNPVTLDNNRNRQKYDVYYSTVNDPLAFVSLFSFAELTTTAKVSSTTFTGLTGVASIRFDIYDTHYNSMNDLPTGYREIDVIGSAVIIPEPSRAVLIGLASLGLLFRRRR